MNRTQKYIFFILAGILFFKDAIPYLNQVDAFSGFIHMRQNRFWGIMIFIFIELVESEWEKWKNRSEKFVMGNLGSTLTSSKKDNEYHGPWVATRLGGLNWAGMSIAGREGTAIHHYSARREMEGGVFVQAWAEEWDLSQFKPDLRQFIKDKKLPAPYYMGVAPIEIEKMNNIYLEGKWTTKAINQLKNEKRMMEKQRMRDTERTVRFRESIGNDKAIGMVTRLKESMNSED